MKLEQLSQRCYLAISYTLLSWAGLAMAVSIAHPEVLTELSNLPQLCARRSIPGVKMHPLLIPVQVTDPETRSP